MKLRRLRQQDAERMIEWMHDPFVVETMHTDFMSKRIEDCRFFIDNSICGRDIHMAIADDNDVYKGTVSLKHISGGAAEFAIVLCRDAMGKGYSIWAMNEILKMGFDDMGLEEIYWCVAANNSRAIRFYDKNHFKRVDAKEINHLMGYSKKQIDSYIWYKKKKYDYTKELVYI